MHSSHPYEPRELPPRGPRPPARVPALVRLRRVEAVVTDSRVCQGTRSDPARTPEKGRRRRGRYDHDEGSAPPVDMAGIEGGSREQTRRAGLARRATDRDTEGQSPRGA